MKKRHLVKSAGILTAIGLSVALSSFKKTQSTFKYSLYNYRFK